MAPSPSAGSTAPAALSLVFDQSAAALPQAEIRAAVEHELGVPVTLEPSADRPTLRVSVAPNGDLLLTYQRPTEALERSLPGPQRSDQVPLLISLAAGNLVRNQAKDLTPRPDTPSSSEAPAPPAPAPFPRAAAPPPVPHARTPPAPPLLANWFGIHLGIDLAPVSSSNACAAEGRMNNFVCFLPDGSTFTGQPSRSAAGAVSSGLTAATVPLLLSYERIFGAFGAEARAGFAFNGGPRPSGGNAFFPLRVELRGKFWPLGTPPSKTGFRPYLHLGAGLAQVDAKIYASIVDCGTAPRPDFFDNCLAVSDPATAKRYGGTGRTVTVVKQLGMAHLTAGGGVAYTVAPHHAIVLNLNFMWLLPATGFALEPSLGYQIGI